MTVSPKSPLRAAWASGLSVAITKNNERAGMQTSESTPNLMIIANGNDQPGCPDKKGVPSINNFYIGLTPADELPSQSHLHSLAKSYSFERPILPSTSGCLRPSYFLPKGHHVSKRKRTVKKLKHKAALLLPLSASALGQGRISYMSIMQAVVVAEQPTPKTLSVVANKRPRKNK